MTFQKRFGIIGVGHIASTIIASIQRANIFLPENITLFDKFSDKFKEYKKYGMNIAASESEVVENSDIILFSVKPQDIDVALDEVAHLTAGKCILTLAAGISTDHIKAHTAPGTSVVRCMPNTALLLGCGATAFASPSADVPADVFECCKSIFSASGHVEVMDERHINSVISVNGSSPAYFYKLISAMCKYAVDQGIDEEAAERLAVMSMEGAAKMLLTGEHHPEELIRMVATPGGTTEAAINSLDDEEFDLIIYDAMASCTRRTEELAKEFEDKKA